MAGFFDFFRKRATSSPAGRTTGEGEAGIIRDLAFREIKKIWSAEDGDIVEREEGFDWLPASHTVHVRMRRDADDPSLHRLWVVTEFLQSVGSDNEKTAVDIGTLTPVICPTFAPVRWSKDGTESGPTDLTSSHRFT